MFCFDPPAGGEIPSPRGTNPIPPTKLIYNDSVSKRTFISVISLVFVLVYTSALVVHLVKQQPVTVSIPKLQKVSVPDIPKASPSGTLTQVTRVIDGDTIVVSTGEKVRYIGMNTPETVDPRRPVQCYGHEASAKNKELVEGKTVRLEKDVSDKDTYGRLLRYVWIGDTMINEVLVREGFAEVSTFPPDVKYKDRFIAAQRLASEEKKGLWGPFCNIRQ